MADVPEGTIDEVLDWVGDDVDRANDAYEAEVAGKGRSTLLTKLGDIMAAADEDEADGSEEPAAPADDGPQYATTKRIRYQGEWYEAGDVLPGAGQWPRIESWVRTGYVRKVT